MRHAIALALALFSLSVQAAPGDFYPGGSVLAGPKADWGACRNGDVTRCFRAADYNAFRDALNDLRNGLGTGFGSGTVGAPSIAFSSEPTTGIYRSAAGSFDVSVLGVNACKFTASGATLPKNVTLSGGTLSLSQAASQAIDKSGGILFVKTSTAHDVVLQRNGSSYLSLTASGIDANGHPLVNVTDPTNAQDAATRGWSLSNFATLSYVNGVFANVSVVPGLTAPTALMSASDASSTVTMPATPPSGPTGGTSRWGCYSGGVNNGITSLAYNATNYAPGTGAVSWLIEYSSGFAGGSVTASYPALATTSVITRTPRTRFTAINTNGSQSGPFGIRANVAVIDRARPFVYWASWTFGPTAPNSNPRPSFGLNPAGQGSSTPSTTANFIGFECGTSETTLKFTTVNSGGTGTRIDLGANFPCMGTTSTYNAAVWYVNATTVGYAIQRVDAAFTASGTQTATLPAAGTFLTPVAEVWTGASSTHDLDIASVCAAWIP